MQEPSIDDRQVRDTSWTSSAADFMRGIDQKLIGNDQLGAFALQEERLDDLLDLSEIGELVRVALTALVASWLRTLRELPEACAIRFDPGPRRVIFVNAGGICLRTSGEPIMIAEISGRTRLTHVQSVLLFRSLALALCSHPPVVWNGLAFEKKETGFRAALAEAQ